MSKVVCDVCGTAYAENLNQCPICGTAKSENARSTSGGQDSGSGYAYVRGGRFSQSNVRKRNNGNRELPRTTNAPKESKPAPKEESPRQSEQAQQRAPRKPQQEPENEQPSNIGLIIIVVILLLAIISLCAYIAIRYIDINNNRESSSSTSGSTSGTLDEIPCTGITIEGLTMYTFDSLSDELMLTVTCQPANTTDLMTWNYDSTIVKVIQNGNQWIIAPVGPGEAVVTVSCGLFTDTITITSNVVVEPDPTDPTDPIDPTDTTGPIDPTFVLELAKTDIKLFYYGETARIYNGSLDASEITWYSEDETVCTIENGVVTAVGPGKTNVFGEYGDQKVSCIVRCTDDVVEPEAADYVLSHTDVTLKVGEAFTLSLKDAETGVKITDVTYSVSEEGFFTVSEKGVVKGVAATGTKLCYVYVEYEGITYKCRVIVREP